jgi:gas vesicle protein GvpN
MYQESHPRKVIGSRLHETMKERSEKRRSVEKENSLYPVYTEFEFLVPAIDNFIETEQVKRLIDRVMRWIDLGYPPHLIGPTGCGKTTIALAVAKRLGQPTLWLNGDDQMTTVDLIGGYSEAEAASVRDKYIHNVVVAKDRIKYVWVDNPLTIACKYGYTLIYNEFSRAKPIANNVLLSVLEEGILELPIMFGTERYVKVHPNFNAIFTSNSIEYAGVYTPQDALLDRMVHIYMDYYDLETEVEIIMKHTGLPEDMTKKIVSAVREIRDKMPLESKPGTRAAIMIGQGLGTLIDSGIEDIKQIYFDVLLSKISKHEVSSKYAALVEEVLNRIYG